VRSTSKDARSLIADNIAREVRDHLLLGGSIRRWTARSIHDEAVTVSIIASEDRGAHASGWWRNADYDRCWHLSICAMTRAGYVDLPDEDRRLWASAVFGKHLSIAWVEPAASKLDIYRDAPASAYTTHVRVFLDQDGHPIKPEGEVYTLKPWADGSSPDKVFR
jgi:hypothetical protein